MRIFLAVENSDLAGMYCGAMVLAGSLVAIIMFYYTNSTEEDELKASEIYVWTDIALHAVLTPPVFYCAVKLSKFRFTYNRGDLNLLATPDYLQF